MQICALPNVVLYLSELIVNSNNNVSILLFKNVMIVIEYQHIKIRINNNYALLIRLLVIREFRLFPYIKGIYTKKNFSVFIEI
jgi:hypothetical protein